MDVRCCLRPAGQLCRSSAFATPARATLSLTSTRGHKTAARTKRSLKMAPHPSFLPDRQTAFPAADQIIYNPPASEASPFHTPFIFLPPTDPRRKLRNDAFAAVARGQSPASHSLALSEQDQTGPPELKYRRRAATPKKVLTPEDVQEMRKLRADDPLTWSVAALARKFDCSQQFIQIAAPASESHKKWLQEKKAKRMERWGPKKTLAREERKMRTEMLYRGDL